MSASYPTKLLLAFRSGDRCAFPGCPRQLTIDAPASGDPVILGEAAHIAGEQSNAARFDASMTDEQRNHYFNLIYLCGDHHTQIDKQHPHFQVDVLYRLKADHDGVDERQRALALEVAAAESEVRKFQYICTWSMRRTASQIGVTTSVRITVSSNASCARCPRISVCWQPRLRRTIGCSRTWRRCWGRISPCRAGDWGGHRCFCRP